jgi:hypothetical protein
MEDVRSMEGLERIGGMPHVVVVEFTLLHQHEAMPGIEAIRRAAVQRSDTHGATFGPCFSEHAGQDSATNAFALVARMDVHVVEQQARLVRLDDEETDALTADANVASVLRRIACEETLSRPQRIEPSDALQTLTHGFDSQRYECLCIAGEGRAVCDGALGFRHSDAL